MSPHNPSAKPVPGPSENPAADCRACVHCHGVREGVSIRCGAEDCGVLSWASAIRPAASCGVFEPRPVPYPASAGEVLDELERTRSRESTLATAARELTRWDWLHLLVDHPDAAEVKADVARLERALSGVPVEDRPGVSSGWGSACNAKDRAERIRGQLVLLGTGPLTTQQHAAKDAAYEEFAALEAELAPIIAAGPAVEDPRDAEIATLRARIRWLEGVESVLSVSVQDNEERIRSMVRPGWLGEYVVGLYYGEERWVRKLRILVKKLRGSGTVRVWPEVGDEAALQKAEAALAEYDARGTVEWDRAVAEARAHPLMQDPRDVLLTRCAQVLTLAYRLMSYGRSISDERGLSKSSCYFLAGEAQCDELREELAKAGVDVPRHLLTAALRAAGVEPDATQGGTR